MVGIAARVDFAAVAGCWCAYWRIQGLFYLRICVYRRYAILKKQILAGFGAEGFGLDTAMHCPGRRIDGPLAG